MSDRDQIVELLARYARALDERDWASLRACFVPGARASFSGRDLEPGIDAIVGHLSQLERISASTHLVGNALVALEGERARVESQALVHLVYEDHVRARGVFYSDVVVRDGGTWRFEERRHRAGWSIDLGGSHV